jgi:hypothetical protein
VSDATERCAICLEPLRAGEDMELSHGAPVHAGCVARVRKPGAKAERHAAVKNARTESGEPICPVCAEPIGTGQGAARASEYMLHVTCWDRGGQAPHRQQ